MSNDPNNNQNLVVPRFFIHTQRNEAKSKAAGRPIYDEMEACEIRMAANKQTVGVFPAHEVFKTIQSLNGEAEELTYAIAYSDQYRKFKANEAQDQSGTPLAELPFLSQGKRLELKALNIHTAEALAALDGTPLRQLGPGGREMKNQSQAYLDKATGSADVTRLAAENVTLRDQLDALQAQVAEIVASKKVTTKPAPKDDAPSPFEDWENDDIKNWIESETGERPKGNPNHATLVARADEVNAALAAKAAEAA